MSDYLPDTPILVRLYCPGCQPEADPTSEILDVNWCDAHRPAWRGVEDAVADPLAAGLNVSTGGESGGDDNRRWCAMFHGRST